MKFKDSFIIYASHVTCSKFLASESCLQQICQTNKEIFSNCSILNHFGRCLNQNQEKCYALKKNFGKKFTCHEEA